MKLEKNWFYYISVALAIIGMLYIIVCGFVSLGAGQEYPYFPKGLLIIALLVFWLMTWLAAALSARFSWDKGLASGKWWMAALEALFVVGILVLAVYVRLWVIKAIPMEPASDYKTYYEIAQLLLDGTIQKYGKGYCNYVAMFPHVMGYCYILMLAFKIFGMSVAVGQYVNIFFAVATVFIVYKIGRKLGGRLAGLVALVLCAFWPSQVLYTTMLSAEYAFTFFFFLCIWLFLSLVMDYNGDTEKPVQAIMLHFLLGVLIALTSAIRPMGLILLVAIVLTIAPQRMKLPPLPPNDIPLAIRFLERGWLRCVMIFIPYMIVSSVISSNIELTVDRTLPSSATSFGYNLLVGLNTESKGGWNDADAALLYTTMEETGSASQAHITCRDLAIQRLIGSPVGNFNLFMEKYELLWGNDDYGATWNIAFLNEQGNMTRARSDSLYQIRDINNILYIVTVFFALIAMIYLWRGKASLASLLSLVYLGTAGMHLFVESQNRYHYFVLQIFMILAGMAVQFIFADEKLKRRKRVREEQVRNEERQKEEKHLDEIKAEQEQLTELRKEALSNVFDMQYALEKGHIVMTVSKAYDEDTAQTLQENEAVGENGKGTAKVVEEPDMAEAGKELVATGEEETAAESDITEELEEPEWEEPDIFDELEEWEEPDTVEEPEEPEIEEPGTVEEPEKPEWKMQNTIDVPEESEVLEWEEVYTIDEPEVWEAAEGVIEPGVGKDTVEPTAAPDIEVPERAGREEKKQKKQKKQKEQKEHSEEKVPAYHEQERRKQTDAKVKKTAMTAGSRKRLKRLRRKQVKLKWTKLKWLLFHSKKENLNTKTADKHNHEKKTGGNGHGK